jgi:hypothetical protein
VHFDRRCREANCKFILTGIKNQNKPPLLVGRRRDQSNEDFKKPKETTMHSTTKSQGEHTRSRRLAWATVSLAALSLCSNLLGAALPTPVVEMRFSEGNGANTVNGGSLAGSATLAQPDGFPAFTNLVPSGPFAPANNTAALDFSDIAAGQGGRAADLTTDPLGTLGSFNAFTLCGWLNARNLNEGWGGNRIAFALDGPGGAGFDLVQLGNGALRIGINQWPDGGSGGPSSSAGVLKADPQAGVSNWVFFAVTYDSSLDSGNLKYFFGSPTKLASIDTASNYKGGLDNGGLIENTGFLTIGNFSDVVGARNEQGPNGGSRVFRGIIDEFKIYDRSFALAEIQQAQLNGALPPVPATIAKSPASLKVFNNQPATFLVQVDGAAPFTYQWQMDGVDITGATNETYTIDTVTMADNGAKLRVKVGNSVTLNLMSDVATLTVVAETGHKVSLSFSEGDTTVTNLGNLEGNGVYAIAQGYPTASAIVPTGSFVPAQNIASVDFGIIAAGQGGRAIDVTNAFDNTLGPLGSFTISGWLNCRDLNEGGGGNRIAFSLETPGGAGFDLVQLGDGALRIGINEWPDSNPGGPASSTGKITADSEAGAANWVFFAVTYDSSLASGNLSYYFGTPGQQAQLDSASDYSRGLITHGGPLTMGNFSTVVGARTDSGPGGGSRCFRGLMDEINVYNRALTLTEIQAQQTAPAYKPAVVEPAAIQQDPQNTKVFAGQNAAFRVTATGTQPLSFQWWKRHAGNDSAITGATNANYTLNGAPLADSGDEYWVVAANSNNSVTSKHAMLTVLAENNHKVFLSFSEGSGTTTANLGNLGGTASLIQANAFPAFTNLTPTGPFTPTANTSSLDFGAIADGDGGRSLDLTTSVTPTLGSMQAFTLTGWLNSRDLQYGPGGNRILYSQTGPGSGGFDLVQQADGVLWLGVNTWPDGNPNSTALSSPRITADPAAGNENWIFFAVTYDGTMATANASFYFGSPSQAAAVDITADYPQGPINSIGQMAAGNFSTVDNGARNATGPGNSRCFRGLMDELNVFNKVLTLDEIQAVQKAPAGVPVAESPKIVATREGGQLVIVWETTANFQLQSRSSLSQDTWADEGTAPVVDGNKKTVRLSLTGAGQFYRLVSR